MRAPRSTRCTPRSSPCSGVSSSATTCSPGIVISLAAALGSFLLLQRVAEERLGVDGARRAVLYLAVFPMTLFLQAVYSESLYLLLAIAAFVLAERGRFGWAGVVTGLAILTRVTGSRCCRRLRCSPGASRDRLRVVRRLALAVPVAAIYPRCCGSRSATLGVRARAGALAPPPLARPDRSAGSGTRSRMGASRRRPPARDRGERRGAGGARSSIPLTVVVWRGSARPTGCSPR